jgi:hypothetical protein
MLHLQAEEVARVTPDAHPQDRVGEPRHGQPAYAPALEQATSAAPPYQTRLGSSRKPGNSGSPESSIGSSRVVTWPPGRTS